jgi:hypothetical protein
LRGLSRAQLEEFKGEVDYALTNNPFEPEEEIAQAHYNPDLIHKVERSTGSSRRLQSIYCSFERCPDCPHGPYWYVYRTSKRKGVVFVRFDGSPAFPPSLIEEMRKHVSPPVAYELRIPGD